MKPKQLSDDKLPTFMVRSDLYLSKQKLINCPKNFHSKAMNEEIINRMARRNSTETLPYPMSGIPIANGFQQRKMTEKYTTHASTYGSTARLIDSAPSKEPFSPVSERFIIDVSKITRFLPSDIKSSTNRPQNLSRTQRLKNGSGVNFGGIMRLSSAPPIERIINKTNGNQILQQRKNQVKQTQSILRDHDLALKQMKTLRLESKRL